MKIEKQKLNESKEALPVSFLTDFISRGWEDIGYLQETIKSIKASFSGTKKVEELLQALLDAYLVCIGQLELHIEDKDYLDIPEEAKKLEEAIDIHIDDAGEVHVSDSSGEEVAVMPIAAEEQEAAKCEGPECEPCEGPECAMPPAEANIEPIAADDGEFNTPFEFDAPEADNVRKFEKPEVADFFVDFDDPVGEPVTEKELYGEGEEPIENEKIDDDIEPEEKADEE